MVVHGEEEDEDDDPENVAPFQDWVPHLADELIMERAVEIETSAKEVHELLAVSFAGEMVSPHALSDSGVNNPDHHFLLVSLFPAPIRFP